MQRSLISHEIVVLTTKLHEKCTSHSYLRLFIHISCYTSIVSLMYNWSETLNRSILLNSLIMVVVFVLNTITLKIVHRNEAVI